MSDPCSATATSCGDPGTKEAIVIDPGDDADRLAASLAERELKVTAIVATHAHFDHIVAAERLRTLTGAPFYLHAEDKPLLSWMQESGRMFLGMDLPPPPEVDTEAREGDRLTAGTLALEVVHTPGHSPGSISLIGDDAVFSGDTLFAGSIGRTDLPGGDTRALLDAVKDKLFRLDLELPVYPGHGPSTTLGAERLHNPFVGEQSRMWLPPE